MSLQTYAIVDPNGVIVNFIDFDACPTSIAAYPDCTAVLNTGAGVDIGWHYINGEFINPAPQPVIETATISVPVPTPTLADLQAQMATLQAHMSTLLGQPSA